MTQTSARPDTGPGAPARGQQLPVISGPLETLGLAWRRLRRLSTALALLFALAGQRGRDFRAPGTGDRRRRFGCGHLMRQPGLPHDRVRLPHLDLRAHRRRDLGRGGLGPLLNWGWDPKETGSFFTRVFSASYLHARSTRSWRGRRAAWIAVVAFVALMVTYYAVTLWIVGLHSYGQ